MLPSPRRLLVLDDDPTGSQCVHDVDAAFTEDPEVAARALDQDGSTCFVLTNSRALDEDDATQINTRILTGVLDRGVGPEGLHVVSRSDSTLRGHVIAEPAALADALEHHGRPVDAILFCPAMLEAGRFTEADVHYATVDGEARRVEDTDFARDATFGYSTSDLREFLAEKSDGSIAAPDVLSVSLEDIRDGGVDEVARILATARDRRWVVINATMYEDMEVVVDAVTRLEAEGRTYLTRCAPSFVRPLAGQRGAEVLDPDAIRIAGDTQPHGLLVVGSHVGLTTTQLEEVQRRGGLAEVELDVPTLLEDSSRDEHIRAAVTTVRDTLGERDCVVYTSRTLVREDDPEKSLAIARSISDAVVEVVRGVRDARPAWVIAKGGITSHEVAAHGLDIRRARVEGQFFPGQISLFTPLDAPEEVLGIPYVVFPGNVGGTDALADVVDRLTTATARRTT
ncbi:MAG: four-carbon acid sugar kinase family protein [Brachybacterium sp.]|nr:four-carbon acid sugar kinase family protein [Brachybacterium sp.]